MTLTFELDLVTVDIDKHTSDLFIGQRSFCLKAIFETYKHTQPTK